MASGRPSTIRILGRDYAVNFAPNGTLRVGDTAVFGYCDTSAQLIGVEEGLHPLKEREVVLHEVLHGVLSSAGFIPNPQDDEESYVCALAALLVGVFQDNPDFAKWLTSPPRTPRKKPA